MEKPVYVTRDFIEDVLRTKLQKKIIILYNGGYKSGEINSSYADRNHLFLNIDPEIDIEEAVRNYYKRGE
jgi:hypothetical protein